MAFRTDHALTIYYEHPDWFAPLFKELDRRGTPYDALNARESHHDPGEPAPYSVLLNRMSPSAYLRGGASAIFYTSQLLAHLERSGVRVINGWQAWQTEISKAYQLTLLDSLKVPYPNARVIHDPKAALVAAQDLRFPVVVKPNVGGSGAGIRRFDTPAELAAARDLNLGLDHTALVQEYVPQRDGRIVRVEVLDGRFLYAIRIYTDGNQFNLCPADVCRDMAGKTLDRAACPTEAAENDLRVEGYVPPPEIVTNVERIMTASNIEVGGVEYMIDDRDGQLYYYDVNAMSNFVADAPSVVGFDPFARLVDWLESEVGRVRAAA